MSNFKKPADNPEPISDKFEASQNICFPHSFDMNNAVGLITPKQYRQSLKNNLIDELQDEVDEQNILERKKQEKIRKRESKLQEKNEEKK